MECLCSKGVKGRKIDVQQLVVGTDLKFGGGVDFGRAQYPADRSSPFSSQISRLTVGACKRKLLKV